MKLGITVERLQWKCGVEEVALEGVQIEGLQDISELLQLLTRTGGRL